MPADILVNLLVSSLAAWYVAYSVTSTHGPYNVFDRLRNSLPHGGLLDCPVCLAFWAALVLLLLPMGIVTQALAVAGGAMILHGLAGWRFGS